MTDEIPHKHPCPDCVHCQWCSDDRCRLCLKKSGCSRRTALSVSEQITLYNSLNPASLTPEEQKE